MDEDKLKTLRKINIESFIWVIYIFLVCFNLYSNYLEKLYCERENRDESSCNHAN